MKRSSVILICIMLVISSSAFADGYRLDLLAVSPEAVRYSIEFPPPDIASLERGAGVWSLFNVDEAGSTTEIGRPELPLVNRLIALPAGSGASVRVIDADRVVLSNISIAPWQKPLDRNGGGATAFAIDEDLYLSGGIWPPAEVEAGAPAVVAGVRVVPVTFYPVRVRPAAGEAIYTRRAVIEVRIHGADLRNDSVRGEALPRVSNALSGALSHLVLNSAAGRDGLSDVPPEYTHWTPSDGTYLILCADALCDAVQPLADWKSQKGLPTEIVLVSEAGSSALAIKNYLAGRYAADPVKLDYVLLVGDVEFIPTFYGLNGTAADHDYTTVDGEDYFPDFIIGRLSVKTADEAAVQAQKSVNYETAPAAPADDWFVSAMTVSSSQYQDDDNAMFCGQKAEEYGFTNVDYFFESNGLNTKGNVRAALNEGRSWISYFGHGDATSWSSVNPSYTNGDVLDLTNGGMLPVITSIACQNGWFDREQDCFADAWMKAGVDKGAAAIFAAARNTPFFYTDALGKAVASGYFVYDMNTFGAASFFGKMGMYSQYPEPAGGDTQEVMQHFHVFGDPELGVWSAAPGSFDEPVLTRAGSNLVMTVSADGAPVANALVHLFNAGLDQAGRTDVEGSVSFSVDQASVPINRVMTARNILPRIDAFTIGGEDDDASDDATDDVSDDSGDDADDDASDDAADDASDDAGGDDDDSGCGC